MQDYQVTWRYPESMVASQGKVFAITSYVIEDAGTLTLLADQKVLAIFAPGVWLSIMRLEEGNGN